MSLSIFSSIDEITPYLYISGYGAVIKQNLKRFGITCVVDATNVPKKPLSDCDFLKVAVEDREFAKLDPYFDLVADKILEHKQKDGKTLVHCAAGISRSAALCIVYLVKYEDMSLKDAYLLVKQKRNIISPNSGFWRQMVAYETKLRGEATVTMIRVARRDIPDVIFAHFPKK